MFNVCCCHRRQKALHEHNQAVWKQEPEDADILPEPSSIQSTLQTFFDALAHLRLGREED